MHKVVKFLTLAILFFSATAFTHMISSSIAVEDAIIAVVNDEVITLRDLREYIRSTYVGLVAEGYSDERIKEIMLDLELNGLDKLIEDKLMLSQANTLGLEINEKLINEKIEEVKARYGSEEKFMQALIQHGATLTDMRNKVLNQLKIKYVINHAVRSKIYISPKEVTDYYENNMNQFRQNEHIMLESIFIPYDKGKAKALEVAEKALEKISSGERFNDVAQDYSKSPSIGQVERGQLMPDIEDVVFALEEGEHSGLVEINTGVYIFQLIKKIPSKIAPLNEVKGSIENILYNEKFRNKFTDWLNELKQDAYIEVKK